ncbi:MAG: NYN domain-containing protein [Cardiobacteriaceae bacterium]|nr:NYN domain-containing protein [Cardiobacteriaceae bacterium]
MDGNKKLAILIDADNASANTAQEIFAEIAKYGIASVRRIYGDWSSPALNGWQKILLKHAITPVQQFAYTRSKDATDMKLIIDAMDLLYSGTFDGFCLISSDSDFTPLAERIRANGLLVYGFGRKTTPEAFRQACDRFFYVENLEAAGNGKPDDGNAANAQLPLAPPVRQPIAGALKNLLYKAIKDCTDETTGWAFVGQIGSYLNQTQPDFDSRTYGYGKLSAMLKAMGGLQFRHDEANRMYCRKIPYGELIKLLANEALPKFRNQQGWAKIHAIEKYVKPRWSFAEYGFASFADLLESVHGVEIQGESMKILPLNKAE